MPVAQGLIIWGTISGVAIFGGQLSWGSIVRGAIILGAIVWGVIIWGQLSGVNYPGAIVLFPLIEWEELESSEKNLCIKL